MKTLNFKSLAGENYCLTHPLSKPGNHGRYRNLRVTGVPLDTDAAEVQTLVNSMAFLDVFEVKFRELALCGILRK